MSILGWVLAWCVSGLNTVTEDLVVEINKELFLLGICLCYPPGTESLLLGPHGYVISIGDPFDWLCLSRHASNIEAE